MRIRLIIFDLDGTLIDSATDIANALNFAIEPYLADRLTVERTIGLVGEGITRLIEKLLGENMKSINTEVLERFVGYYDSHLTDFTTLYSGVKETLSDLGDYRKAVVSNKRELFSKRILNRMGIGHYFDLIVGSDSVQERKPSPEPLFHVLKALSFGPEEAIIVGDSNYDIEAGKSAGMKTVAVSYGYRPLSVLREADAIIDHFADLKDVLKSLED